MMPEKIAARKQPVPVAVSQLKSNLAFSAVGLVTTGCARNTALWRYGTSQPPVLKLGVVALPIAFLMVGSPHTSTKTERMAKGSQALAICPPLWPVMGAVCCSLRTSHSSSIWSEMTGFAGEAGAEAIFNEASSVRFDLRCQL